MKPMMTEKQAKDMSRMEAILMANTYIHEIQEVKQITEQKLTELKQAQTKLKQFVQLKKQELERAIQLAEQEKELAIFEKEQAQEQFDNLLLFLKDKSVSFYQEFLEDANDELNGFDSTWTLYIYYDELKEAKKRTEQARKELEQAEQEKEQFLQMAKQEMEQAIQLTTQEKKWAETEKKYIQWKINNLKWFLADKGIVPDDV
jgi:chromosome segregation ATPase